MVELGQNQTLWPSPKIAEWMIKVEQRFLVEPAPMAVNVVADLRHSKRMAPVRNSRWGRLAE
jgi:hypothetical protein